MNKNTQHMTTMKDERNLLRMIKGQYMREDPASFSVQDISNLQQQIRFLFYKVCLSKVTKHVLMLNTLVSGSRIYLTSSWYSAFLPILLAYKHPLERTDPTMTHRGLLRP